MLVGNYNRSKHAWAEGAVKVKPYLHAVRMHLEQ